ncbi:17813_t:CDS:1, partial [Cetraspora pellucida]
RMFLEGLKSKIAAWLSVAKTVILEKAILGMHKIEAKEYYNKKNEE